MNASEVHFWPYWPFQWCNGPRRGHPNQQSSLAYHEMERGFKKVGLMRRKTISVKFGTAATRWPLSSLCRMLTSPGENTRLVTSCLALLLDQKYKRHWRYWRQWCAAAAAAKTYKWINKYILVTLTPRISKGSHIYVFVIFFKFHNFQNIICTFASMPD